MSNQYDQYSMNIQYDPIDHIYVVTVPELPGCRTHGKTYEEAGCLDAGHMGKHTKRPFGKDEMP